MSLFVVNRHEENDRPEQQQVANESQNLAKVLRRIERNRELKKRRKEKAKQEEAEEKTLRKQRRALVAVPEGTDELIDENLTKTAEDVEEKADDGGGETTKDVKQGKRKKKKKGAESVEGFTILGSSDFQKKGKVSRVLPRWLTNPTVISVDLQNLTTKVSSLKQLDKRLRTKLKADGVKYFFPVQAQLIPWLLRSGSISHCIRPNDVCVSAPTGSGKTLAFVLPIVQSLLPHKIKRVRALVILPTQDLAVQVYKTFRRFTGDTHLKVCFVSAKGAFEQEQKQLVTHYEAFGYMSKVDIVVATAGRLVDHLKSTPGFDLGHLEYLVIDEADRVLDHIQNDWLYHLEKHIYTDDLNKANILNLNSLKLWRGPQKLLFSATLSQDPEKLQKMNLFQPRLFTSIVEGGDRPDEDDEISAGRFVGKYTTPKELTERYVACSLDLKPLVLYELIRRDDLKKTIVFTHSLESAHRLMILLGSLFGEGKKVEKVASTLEPRVRNKLLDDFEKGEIDVLVCTDALARGIDLPAVKCVVSYSMPKHLKTYIHRVGRTARAGEEGVAVTLLHGGQRKKFLGMLEQASKKNVEEVKIGDEMLEQHGPEYEKALSKLKDVVNKEKDLFLKKTKSAKRISNKKRKRIDSV